MSGLDCDNCESKLHLAYGEKILTLSFLWIQSHTSYLWFSAIDDQFVSPHF